MDSREARNPAAGLGRARLNLALPRCYGVIYEITRNVRSASKQGISLC
jgi:hypothetical protein